MAFDGMDPWDEHLRREFEGVSLVSHLSMMRVASTSVRCLCKVAAPGWCTHGCCCAGEPARCAPCQ